MAFPTLKRKPVSCSSEPLDDTIKAGSEAGYMQARPRTTRRRVTFAVSMLLDDADWALLDNHDKTVGGSGIFAWTHPVSGTVYQVRYSKRVKENPINLNGHDYLHQVDFELEQA